MNDTTNHKIQRKLQI